MKLDKNILSHLPIVLAQKTPKLKFIDANDFWLNIAGFKSVDQIVGLSDEDCPWADFIGLYKQHELDALNGKVYSALQPAKTDNSGYCWYHNHKYPVYDKDGKVEYLQVVAHEIINPGWNEFINHLHSREKFDIEQYFIDKPTEDNLSKREQEVLFLFIRNLSAKEIGSVLNISVRTAERHISNIKEKFDCYSRSQVTEYALTKGYAHIIPGNILLHKKKL